MVGVVTKAGHEDDGEIGAGEACRGEDFVAGLVGHFDIGEDQVEGGNFLARGGIKGGDGGGTRINEGDFATVVAKDVADDLADAGFIVGDEDAFAIQEGFRDGFGLSKIGGENGLRASGKAPGAVADIFGGSEEVFDLGGGFVAATFAGRCGEATDGIEELIQGLPDFGFDAFAGDFVGVGAFDDEEVEGVQGEGDVAGEHLGEETVFFGKVSAFAGFDVEDADDAIGEFEGDGEGGASSGEPGEEERVAGGVVADVALSGGGDVAGDAVALGLGVDVDITELRGHAVLDGELEFAGFFFEDADGEVIEVKEFLGVADDLLFGHTQTVHRVHPADRFGVEGEEVAASTIDGFDFLAEGPFGGDIADDDGVVRGGAIEGDASDGDTEPARAIGRGGLDAPGSGLGGRGAG